MRLQFTKMHGCGNDYIYINCFDTRIPSPKALAVKLSDRHTGVGGDGIVLILPSDIADARMRMFNLDGSEGNMCGNAIRCVAKYLYDNGFVKKLDMTIETKSGIKRLWLTVKDGTAAAARVDMGPAVLRPSEIPVNMAGESIIARPVSIGGERYQVTCVSMGNPHVIVFRGDVESLELDRIGPLFENDGLFPDRINAEFVKVVSRNRLKLRVWERGSGETLACGTGACASAVAAVLNGYCDRDSDIAVELLGGELCVRYTDKSVYMTGGCTKVFDGIIEI